MLPAVTMIGVMCARCCLPCEVASWPLVPGFLEPLTAPSSQLHAHLQGADLALQAVQVASTLALRHQGPQLQHLGHALACALVTALTVCDYRHSTCMSSIGVRSKMVLVHACMARPRPTLWTNRTAHGHTVPVKTVNLKARCDAVSTCDWILPRIHPTPKHPPLPPLPSSLSSTI